MFGKGGGSVLGTVRRDSLRSEDYNGSIILLLSFVARA